MSMLGCISVENMLDFYALGGKNKGKIGESDFSASAVSQVMRCPVMDVVYFEPDRCSDKQQ